MKPYRTGPIPVAEPIYFYSLRSLPFLCFSSEDDSEKKWKVETKINEMNRMEIEWLKIHNKQHA